MLSPRFFAVCLVAFASALAQRPGPSNITASHIHLISADPAAAIPFWADVIGMSSSSGKGFVGVSSMGVTILIDKKTVSRPSAGSTIDHIALKVPDLGPVEERLKKTAYKSSRPAAPPDRLMIDGPDGVRVELIEDNSMYAALEFSHIHLNAKQPKEIQDWYVKNLGARAGHSEEGELIMIPGATMAVSQLDTVSPGAGAIDHVSFEVKDLDALFKKLSDGGAKVEAAPHAAPELNATVAMVTDPWGTRLELVEKTAK